MIDPPLLNSSNPWCTTLEQLRELYDCPYTGAVTTRTSLISGFPNDPSIHQYTFFNPKTSTATADVGASTAEETGSLNTLGYSPLPLSKYLEFIKQISEATFIPTSPSKPTPQKTKPFIISVTGSTTEVCECYRLISAHQRLVYIPLAMEINLSCPNIPDKPPPAYHSHHLAEYLSALKSEVARSQTRIPVGIKTPPYTYTDQFRHMIAALSTSATAAPVDQPCPISFITATNTLGSSLLLTPTFEAPTLISSDTGSPVPREREVYHHTLASASGTGIGGLAGAPLHPLALGNVYTIKGMLFQHPELEGIKIIGVGGVEDGEGYNRMRAVGASAVGVGTALGRKGVAIFAEILPRAEKKGTSDVLMPDE